MPQPRQLADVINAGTNYLAQNKIPFPRVAAELLVARLLNCRRLELYQLGNLILTESQLAALRRGFKRVAACEPIQYVLGEWDFRGLSLKVDKRALIPRPETEELVSCVLDTKELWLQNSPLIVDVGTGSGCIVLSLAKERPQARYIAIDASKNALELAQENAIRNTLADQVEFRVGYNCGDFIAGSVDTIVSNPPYIPSAEIAKLDACIRNHEPHMALDGGADGLEIIKNIIPDAHMVLRKGGWIFLEIGDGQGPAVREILEKMGFIEVMIKADLSGKTRYAIARNGN